MKYLLDTDTCIYLIKKDQITSDNFSKHNSDDFAISIITYSELLLGIAKSQYKERNKIALLLFLARIQIVDFNKEDAEIYSEIRADLEQKGQVIGGLDMLIASQAKRLGYTLITNNVREYGRVNDLVIENWSR